MNKQTKIDAIERRILDEYRKYFQADAPTHWAKTAAVKIYSMFDEVGQLEKIDSECERLQQFYGSNDIK